jgi:drug/metabolite transporter (DMT)-like permease
VHAFGILAGLAAASIWGGMFVVSKVVLDIIPPFTLVSLRLILGIGCLALILAFRGGFQVNRLQAIEAVGVGFIGFGVSIGLQFLGTKLSTAANVIDPFLCSTGRWRRLVRGVFGRASGIDLLGRRDTH